LWRTVVLMPEWPIQGYAWAGTPLARYCPDGNVPFDVIAMNMGRQREGICDD